MYSINKDNTNEIIIKNSRFITVLFKVNSINQVDEKLKMVREKYPKATHYCYGYIIDDKKKSSDDGEPSNTAGLPILNVLDKEKLNNILVIVVRYFGGIKLGAGGLVRAYTKSVTTSLNLIKKIELINGYKIEIEFDYKDEKQINYILKDSILLDKKFDKCIIYTALINDSIKEKISNYKYKIISNCYIEKK